MVVPLDMLDMLDLLTSGNIASQTHVLGGLDLHCCSSSVGFEDDVSIPIAFGFHTGDRFVTRAGEFGTRPESYIILAYLTDRARVPDRPGWTPARMVWKA